MVIEWLPASMWFVAQEGVGREMGCPAVLRQVGVLDERGNKGWTGGGGVICYDVRWEECNGRYQGTDICGLGG